MDNINNKERVRAQEALTDANNLDDLQPGAPDYIAATADRLLARVGGTLTAENMSELTENEITLIAYRMMRDEVMDGGFLGLIYNGLGPFIFLNPFAKAIRLMGQGTPDEDLLHDLSKLIYKGRKLYERYGEKLNCECKDDEEFMALYEQFPEFDDLDDEFVGLEEEFSAAIERQLKIEV